MTSPTSGRMIVGLDIGTSKVVAACDQIIACPSDKAPDAAALATIAAHIEGVKAEERAIPRDNAATRFPVFWA